MFKVWTRDFLLSSRVIISALLAFCFGISLYLRIALPYDRVFSGNWIKFTGIDAYYHMRLIDNLASNFPRFTSFDPYFIYPGGATVGGVHFFDWLIAAAIWIVGLGSPTQQTIDIVGVYFPVVLGVLTIIPIYFIGKELFNRWAGVISAFLIAVMPGDSIGRSMLGFTDHHVAEVLFSTTIIMFLIMAIKVAKQKHLTLNHLYKRDWSTISKPVIYSLLAGIFLGFYLLTWLGALLLVFILSVFFIVQFIIDHWKRSSGDYLVIPGSIFFLVALIMFLPFSPQFNRIFYSLPLVTALFIPFVLYGISRLMSARGIRTSYYPLTLLGVGLIGITIFFAINPMDAGHHSLLSSLLREFKLFNPFFNPAEFLRGTIEARPLFYVENGSPLSIAWDSFTVGFFLSLTSIGILLYMVIKRGEVDKTLLVIWSLIMLAAVIGQRRFAYYFAVNVAVLSGYFSWQFIRFMVLLAERLHDRIDWPTLRRWMVDSLELPRLIPSAAEQGKEQRSGHGINLNRVSMVLAVIIVFFIVIYPNLLPARTIASQARFAPTEGWMNALTWMKENTPEPFGDPGFYYEYLSPEQATDSKNFVYPDSAYGVLAWWDYGYWITRIAHRVPVTNPSQDPVKTANVARYFTSQDESAANEILADIRDLKRSDSVDGNVPYVIIDYQTAITKFPAIAIRSGQGTEEIYDFYLVPQNGGFISVPLFYPAYYRSLSTRLYIFDGDAVIPTISWVISYGEKVINGGEPQKHLTGVEQFDTYEEAEAYRLSQSSDNYRIVSVSPFLTPVPLEAVQNYRLVHSAGTVMHPDVGVFTEVKIFEYTE